MELLKWLSGCDNSKDKEACAESLVGLATCLPYVGGTAKSPTPDCCNGLKQLLKTNKKCLCVVIKDRNDPDLGLNINVTLALSLPHVCNAPANISQCPALLNLPPNSPDAQVFYQLDKNSSSVAGGIYMPNYNLISIFEQIKVITYFYGSSGSSQSKQCPCRSSDVSAEKRWL
ncbi:non-specific lipid transfer protein GPI-anchored 14-like [Salvia miltiorrhiza]|uniref:non-specific lipid transfer protein GPI-anchored 14-like n=1 Tax=Salvia miltiorrhiza TaxID=226208 RepID=UPI0025AC26C8|nr:non-specific lipid transfer protein GPI-anchored 14-like [Salvia miltiorrhiza]